MLFLSHRLGANEIPYDIADFRCELHTTDAAVPILSCRVSTRFVRIACPR
jgi:hypothetical protein